MSAKQSFPILPAALLLAASNADAAFMAYNDLASSVSGEYSGTNITDYSLPTTSGLLTDLATGAQPGYTLAVIGDPGGQANVSGTTGNGADPQPGTDAYSVFGDAVNMIRYIQGSGGEGFVDLVFSGLSMDELYEVVLFGERSPADNGRPTQFTISGADAFVNASTVGTTFSGPGDASVSYDTAPNDTTGYVARFTDIAAGADGSFTVRVDDPTPDDEENWYVNALAFSTVPVPAPVALIALGLAGLGLSRRAALRR